jgi:hypothetical protein
MIFPLSYKLKLNKQEFKMFMENVYAWLPFDSDEATNQRSRKWMSNDGIHEYNDGLPINVYDFMPSTKGQKEMTKSLMDVMDNGALSKVESWLIRNGQGQRNNTLIKYALLLVDSGDSARSIESKVMEFNNKFDEPLDEREIMSTVMKTVFIKIGERHED